MSLLAAFVTGTAVWELINPVTTVYRGLIFGMGLAWWIILAIFLFDLIVSKRGWCGHLCPQGAFYSLLAVYAPLRVSATRRAQCNDCMDCFAVCPEPQVIPPALKGEQKGVSPLIDGINCTNCARCIDVCSKDVFEITTRFSNKTKTINLAQQREALP
jgi:ferredoxin-type protein NapH